MPRDPRIDAYIAKAQPFARPILKKMRTLVHKGCPGVTETIKWGMPSFEYKGPYFGFAAFKQHCVGSFWKYKLLDDPGNHLGERRNRGGEAMGNLGRVTSLRDLPPDAVLLDFFRQARRLNDEGIRPERAKPKPKKAIAVPAAFSSALLKNKKAQSFFDKFPPSHRREYLEWITEAKQEATRARRIAQAVAWIEKGKPRNWKYARSKGNHSAAAR